MPCIKLKRLLNSIPGFNPIKNPPPVDRGPFLEREKRLDKGSPFQSKAPKAPPERAAVDLDCLPLAVLAQGCFALNAEIEARINLHAKLEKALERRATPGMRIEVGNGNGVLVVESDDVTVTDVEQIGYLARITEPLAFDDLVRETRHYAATDKLKALVCDGDSDLGIRLRQAVAVRKMRTVYYLGDSLAAASQAV